jgi:DNA-binding transcriptional regulator YiaG
MDMSPEKLAETLKSLGLEQKRFARWLGLNERSLRRYTQREGTPGSRKVPPSMALLVTLLEKRPELVPVIEDIAEKD